MLLRHPKTRCTNAGAAAALLALLLSMAPGCGQKAGELFPAPAQPIVWPEPPEPPRIRHVGQLATSADLKPAVSFAKQLGRALFGKKPDHSLVTPYAICTDGADRLFIADTGAGVVHVMDLNRRVYAQWIPPGARNRFEQPVGIAYDPHAHRLFVADSGAGCIYVFDSSGQASGIIGREFVQRPCGLAFDATGARLFVADAAAHQIVLLSTDGRLIHRVGRRGTEPGEFNYPTNVALDSYGRLYVSDSLNFRVQLLSTDLTPLRAFGRKGDMPGYFSQPKGLAVDSQDHLYVVDANFEAIQVFDDEGELLLSFGQEGQGPGEFWLPAGIFIDPHDRIWTADAYNRRVQVFDYLPEVTP